jgi:hypothetical protein
VIQQTTIIGQFEDPADAQRAVDELASAGVAGEAVRLLPGAGSATGGVGGASHDSARDGGGFLSSFGGMSIPEEDRRVYAEGMRRGLTTVVVRVDAARAPAVEETLERNGAVDLDEREASVALRGLAGRRDGRRGRDDDHRPRPPPPPWRTRRAPPPAWAPRRSARTAWSSARRSGSSSASARRPAAGCGCAATSSRRRSRSRSRCATSACHVERRPVDRPVQPGDAVFEERVIEASERSEEAVVTKEARVVEEIGLRKEADTRTETVRDTVRRQEVEVEDDRTARGGTGVVTETAVETSVTRDDGATGRDRR